MPFTLFLASASAAKPQAKALAAALSSDTVRFLPWWEAFPAGRTLLSELEAIRSKVHGALLVVTPDTSSVYRARPVEIPNLNVLFEFGYFYGAFPKERVAIVKYGEYHLPNNLDGYIHIFGSKSFNRNRALPVSRRTHSEFARWLPAVGRKKPQPQPYGVQVQQEPRQTRRRSYGLTDLIHKLA